MNPLDQRIAIAEANGHAWTLDDTTDCGCKSWKEFADRRGIEVIDDSLPDYLNDLNAMHEVEKIMRHPMTYVISLHRICNNDQECWDLPTTDLQFNYVTATAAQRAEAYLRTINKWKD